MKCGDDDDDDDDDDDEEAAISSKCSRSQEVSASAARQRRASKPASPQQKFKSEGWEKPSIFGIGDLHQVMGCRAGWMPCPRRPFSPINIQQCSAAAIAGRTPTSRPASWRPWRPRMLHRHHHLLLLLVVDRADRPSQDSIPRGWKGPPRPPGSSMPPAMPRRPSTSSRRRRPPSR